MAEVVILGDKTMIHLDIDSEEKKELTEFLDRCLKSLKVEVAHTDHLAFRDMLKQKEKVLERVLKRLQQGVDR